jgi:hypothetical protein
MVTLTSQSTTIAFSLPFHAVYVPLWSLPLLTVLLLAFIHLWSAFQASCQHDAWKIINIAWMDEWINGWLNG